MAQTLRQSEVQETAAALAIEPWNNITEPGAYVFLDSGELVRVPKDALAAGHSPLVTITSKYPRMVARISNDAFIPLSKARQLAADADLHVNF